MADDEPASGVVYVVVKGGDTLLRVFADLREAWEFERQQTAETGDSVEVRSVPFD